MGNHVKPDKKTPKIVAHRGDMEHFPENSMAAFRSALDKGADIIEFDVHETIDKQIAVFHDYYLERQSNGSGFIGDFTLKELKTLDIGSWFNPKFSTQKISTFEEVLAIGKGKIGFEIEVKTPTKSFLNNVIEALGNAGQIVNSTITSQHLLLHPLIKQTEPTLAQGLFFPDKPEWMKSDLAFKHILASLKLASADTAFLHINLMQEKGIRLLQKAGYQVHISCTEHKDRIANCIKSSANQLSTNFLDEAIRIRKSFTHA